MTHGLESKPRIEVKMVSAIYGLPLLALLAIPRNSVATAR